MIFKAKEGKNPRLEFSFTEKEAEKITMAIRDMYKNVRHANQPMWELYYNLNNYLQGKDVVVLAENKNDQQIQRHPK